MPPFRIVSLTFPNFILTGMHSLFFQKSIAGLEGLLSSIYFAKRPMTEKKHIVSLVLEQRIALLSLRQERT